MKANSVFYVTFFCISTYLMDYSPFHQYFINRKIMKNRGPRFKNRGLPDRFLAKK